MTHLDETMTGKTGGSALSPSLSSDETSSLERAGLRAWVDISLFLGALFLLVCVLHP